MFGLRGEMFKLLLAIFTIFTCVSGIHAASFDCNKAKTRVELSICANDELSELDIQMMQSYQNALKNVDNQNELKSEQKLWLKNQRDNCLDSNCLIKVYRKRIDELNIIQLSTNKGYKINYLNNGKIKLSYGNLSKTFDLTDHINGCKGNLYDSSTKETIKSAPSVYIVSMLKKSKITTLLLLVTTSPNCNIQGECGAATNSDLIALTITNKLNQVHINSFKLVDCYSGRSTKYYNYEEFYTNYVQNMSDIIKPMKSKIKIEFNELNSSGNDIEKMVIFDMEEPSKGFIVGSSTSTKSPD